MDDWNVSRTFSVSNFLFVALKGYELPCLCRLSRTTRVFAYNPNTLAFCPSIFTLLNKNKLKNQNSLKNYSKCRIWTIELWHFSPIFVLLKVTCLVTLFARKLQIFKNSPKLTIFGIFMNFCPFKMSHLIFPISAFSTNFWPIKSDLSGNTVWPQTLGI